MINNTYLIVFILVVLVLLLNNYSKKMNENFADIDITPVRYIRIGSSDYLQISQIAVYSNNVNIAIGKTVTASKSHSVSSNKDKAIDGNLLARKYPDIYHSADKADVYWQLDLGKEYHIDRIEYYNRSDTCCFKRALNMKMILVNNKNQKVAVINSFTADPKQSFTFKRKNLVEDRIQKAAIGWSQKK